MPLETMDRQALPWTEWLRALAIFIATYVSLYFGYLKIPDEILDNQVYHLVITVPCAMLIHAIASENLAHAVGPTIVWGPNSLGIVRGCDGASMYFLLVAAIMASRVRWRRLLRGVVGATAFVYVLNEVRILVLYFVMDRRPNWFTPLHAYIFPTLLVLLGVIYFSLWMSSADEPARAS